MKSLRGLVLMAVWPAVAAGQRHSHEPLSADDSAAARFVAAARDGLARYRDRSVAIADGYRQVGPDLPAMGEHWLNIGLILADSIDAEHPPVLIYVASPNGPVLAGAAYTRLLGANDSYPDFPRGRHEWHDHSGLIEDEALPTAHVTHSPRSTLERTRLGILHLWTGIENPEGKWTADNWALPFVRAGLTEHPASELAARALTLEADSGAYYVGVFSRVGRLDSVEVAKVRGILLQAAGAIHATRPAIGPLNATDVSKLELIWTELWPRITQSVPREATTRLEELHRLWWRP